MKKAANLIGIALIALAFLALVQKPGPGPGPGPVKGLRVIFVYESSKSMPGPQQAAFDSTEVASWLDSKCVDGRQGWRKWDKDVDPANETTVWKAIWTETKPILGDLPQVIVVSGQKGKAYPFPADKDKLLEFLKKFGG